MRWTLGLVCLTTACFGERSESSTTTADDTTTASTSTTTATATGATESDATTTITTTSGDTDSSGPPDMTESSGADTTTGDMCGGPGLVPNPPPPPRDWQVVFVSMPAMKPPGCPMATELVAVGHVVPPQVGTCECRCDEPFEALCTLTYASGETCPVDGGDISIDAPCEVLPDTGSGFVGDSAGSMCNPMPVLPVTDIVHVCAVDPTDEPCIDAPPDLIGPCIFQAGNQQCPGGTERVEAGRDPTCQACQPGCQIAAHCNSASFEVFDDVACEGKLLVEFSDAECHETKAPGASIRATPMVGQGCTPSSLTLDELTVCCPM